jgi:HSP20 family molecular chaperone IbpA
VKACGGIAAEENGVIYWKSRRGRHSSVLVRHVMYINDFSEFGKQLADHNDALLKKWINTAASKLHPNSETDFVENYFSKLCITMSAQLNNYFVGPPAPTPSLATVAGTSWWGYPGWVIVDIWNEITGRRFREPQFHGNEKSGYPFEVLYTKIDETNYSLQVKNPSELVYTQAGFAPEMDTIFPHSKHSSDLNALLRTQPNLAFGSVEEVKHRSKYTITLDTPGVRREDVQLEYNEGTLTVKGIRAKTQFEMENPTKVSGANN